MASTSPSLRLQYREALQQDIPPLLKLLADDQLGVSREDPSEPVNAVYLSAFEKITADSNNELTVVELDNEIVGMLQLTFIPYLSHKGSWRCLIEGVRVKKNYRSQGLGTAIFKWAINRAKMRECQIVQLTSNKQRSDALRFYKTLGFDATHEGFKLTIR